MIAYADDYRLMMFLTLAALPTLLLMRGPEQTGARRAGARGGGGLRPTAHRRRLRSGAFQVQARRASMARPLRMA